MREETECAIVDLYRTLLRQHLISRRPRLNRTQVMTRVRKRYDYSRARIYEFIRKHDPSLIN